MLPVHANHDTEALLSKPLFEDDGSPAKKRKIEEGQAFPVDGIAECEFWMCGIIKILMWSKNYRFPLFAAKLRCNFRCVLIADLFLSLALMIILMCMLFFVGSNFVIWGCKFVVTSPFMIASIMCLNK